LDAAHFNNREVEDMRYVRVALLATAAIGLMAIAAPASAETVSTPDGHYYKLVPAKAPLYGTVPEMVTIIPGQATASVAPVSGCRLINFQNGEYQPEYTTVCGPQ
jgi:hypothetical protein